MLTLTEGVVGGAMVTRKGGDVPVFGEMQDRLAVTVTRITSPATSEEDVKVGELVPTGLLFTVHW
jgi:hypothetical protein